VAKSQTQPHEDVLTVLAANLLDGPEVGNVEFSTSNGKSIFAHRGVLTVRSEYFKASIETPTPPAI
jgi:hypothetical protein